MITRSILIVFFLFFSCSSPQKPDTDSIIKNGDALIKKADELEKKYKKNPVSVSVKDIKEAYEGIRENWFRAKEALIESKKYGEYWENKYSENEFFANVGKWVIGIISLLTIAGIFYLIYKVYISFSPAGFLKK